MEHDKTELELPPSVHLIQHQIAGRHCEHRLSMFKYHDGSVLKLWLGDGRGEKEESLYKLIFESKHEDPILGELRKFLPKFKGVCTIDFNGISKRFLKLEDVGEGFLKPSNLDIKIGSINCHPTESAEKIKHHMEKYPEGSIIGFRILGMHIYNSDLETYEIIQKNFGLNLTTLTINDGLFAYFNRENTCLTLFTIAGFLHHLKNIENWFRIQKRFMFLRSSLLFFYESDVFAWLSTLQSWFDVYPFSKLFISEGDNESLKDILPTDFDNSKSLKSFLNNIFTKNLEHFAKDNVCSVCFLNINVCSKMQSSSLINVRMIDFAHFYNSEVEDENYLFGLCNLIKNFQKLQQDILKQYSC